jgi:beta-1,4-mannosyltransferase
MDHPPGSTFSWIDGNRARIDSKQNPPSIPTFHVTLIIAWLRGSKVLIDWHNYGHTLLATGSVLKKPLIPIYKRYETFFGRHLGDMNLAVTDAMAEQLREPPFKISTPVYTLHDRPAEIFQPILAKKARLAFLAKLAETRNDAKNIVDGRIRLLVSSTSWTPDEDFQILLDALVDYANRSESDAEAPSPILAIITGKGPQKTHYMTKIQELQQEGKLPGIRVITAWLSNRDYASLLACADLGISLHKSSSGVDLPMKVVDMFGAGLPVAAYSAFESFGELIKEGENGRGFETAQELAAILRTLLSMQGEETLAELKEGAVREGSLRWDEEWNKVVKPIIDGPAP